MRKPPSYQGIIYGKNNNINGVELTNIMYQIKSAIFADMDVRILNKTMVEGPPASSSTPLRTSVCYPSIILLADMIRRPCWARIYAAEVYITKTRSYTKTNKLQITTQNTCFPHKSLNAHAVYKRDGEIFHTRSACPSRYPTSGFFPLFPNNLITDQKSCKEPPVRPGLRIGRRLQHFTIWL